MAFEEEYEDVLQNIEFAIIRVYRKEPDLIDFDVDEALDALIKTYKAEQQDREPKPLRLADRPKRIYDRVQTMCEWRLGRVSMGSELPEPEPLTLDEMQACLKRVKKSVGFWTRKGGRQGYLDYADQFIP